VRSKLPGRPLYLLSSSGEELKKLDLLPSVRGSRSNWNEFLVSSSGGTVLVGQSVEGMVHYRLLESDTFETKFEWTHEAGSDSPWIVALSDKELLGFRNLKNQEKRGPADTARDLYARSFDGLWRPLHAALDVSSHGGIGQGLHPTQLAFLSDSVIVGANAKRKELESSIVVLQSDGTILSPPAIPKLPDRHKSYWAGCCIRWRALLRCGISASAMDVASSGGRDDHGHHLLE